MFARDKRIGPYTYVYLVENVREEGRTKQRIIANLGRKEVVVARGDLDRLGALRRPAGAAFDGAVAGRGRSPTQCKVSADWTGRCCSSGCGMRSAAAQCYKSWPQAGNSSLLPSARYS